jgi:hypothetical protein
LSFAVVLVTALLGVTVLLWDAWVPAAAPGRRRPGAVGVVLTLAFVALAMALAVLAQPGARVLAVLGLGVLAGVQPAWVAWRCVRQARARQAPAGARSRAGPPEPRQTLVAADTTLQQRYTDLLQRFDAQAHAAHDAGLTEEGRALARALSEAADLMGFSKAHESSPDIPLLIYWAAEVARRSVPPGHPQQRAYEQRLRHYAPFPSTAGLWRRYADPPAPGTDPGDLAPAAPPP